MFLVPSCSCLCPIYWSHVLSREWRCSWGSADRRCSNYIWVIDNLIANLGASYIRELTVYSLCTLQILYCASTCMYYFSDIYYIEEVTDDKFTFKGVTKFLKTLFVYTCVRRERRFHNAWYVTFVNVNIIDLSQIAITKTDLTCGLNTSIYIYTCGFMARYGLWFFREKEC